MTDGLKAILKQLATLKDRVERREDAVSLAAKFFTDPTRHALSVLADEFLWTGQEIDEVISQVNLLLDDGPDNFPENVETPGN